MSSDRQAHSGFEYPQKIEEASIFLRKYTWYSEVAIDAHYGGPGASGTPATSTTDPATMERRIVDPFNSAKVFVQII